MDGQTGGRTTEMDDRGGGKKGEELGTSCGASAFC